jgi:hypothetical protein
MHRGAAEEAERELAHALDIDSQNQIALLHWSALGRSPVALKERLQKFLAAEPRNTDIRYALAVTLFKESNWAGCERELSQLLADAPQHAKGRQLRDELNRNRHLPV